MNWTTEVVCFTNAFFRSRSIQIDKCQEFLKNKLINFRISIAGSLIGGIEETQEVIDLCFKHGIYPDCKIVEAKDIDSCWEALMKTNADGIRYVIDVKKSLQNKQHLPK